MAESSTTEPTAPGMLAPARRDYILDALERDGTVRSSQLLDELGVTPVTLRRDLAKMESDGFLVRVHGGAVRHPNPRPRRLVPVSTPTAPAAPPIAQGAIAALVPSLQFYWPSVVRGMEREARARGAKILPRSTSYEMQDERPVLERLVQNEDIRGLIVAPNTHTPHAQDVIQWIHERGIPTVLVERDAVILPTGEPFESVTTDHALGTVRAARHLGELGHKRMGLVLSRDSPTARKIAAGWQAAIAELGLDDAAHFEEIVPDRSNPEFSATVEVTIDKAIEHGVTALLVHSDPEAMAFIDIASSRGISVPEQLSIVAYDDVVADLFTPAMTAVRPPREAVGAAAVDLLLRRIAEPNRPVHRTLLSPRLIVRSTTAPPPRL